jgi:hypothetical protein
MNGAIAWKASPATVTVPTRKLFRNMSHGAWYLKYSEKCNDSSEQFSTISLMLPGKSFTDATAKSPINFWLLEILWSVHS